MANLVCEKCGWYTSHERILAQQHEERCAPELGRARDEMIRGLERAGYRCEALGYGDRKFGIRLGAHNDPKFGEIELATIVIGVYKWPSDGEGEIYFGVDHVFWFEQLPLEQMLLLLSGLSQAQQKLEALRTTCPDSHCELVKGHAGPHQMKLRVR